MPRNKKRPTFIKSVRIDFEMKQFLESLDNANEFVIQLIRETEDYKKFIQLLAEQDLKNQPRLFADDELI